MLFFFFKQNTAYEVRISDWSADVCSSDLQVAERGIGPPVQQRHPVIIGADVHPAFVDADLGRRLHRRLVFPGEVGAFIESPEIFHARCPRSLPSTEEKPCTRHGCESVKCYSDRKSVV